ncbi:hypothetical protein RND81_04G037700 [Saponaria officinalis]|uniref:DUF4371 domain-containing protein n=1 Tax=Saponaria officinalis TaxID=3572 RepID=A0AAW1LI65_SAPOF
MSVHNNVVQSLEDLKKKSLPSLFANQSKESKLKYQKRLEVSIKCLKWLSLQGLPARGHDESETSSNEEDVDKFVLKNAPANSQMTAPSIQKDIINAFMEHFLGVVRVANTTSVTLKEVIESKLIEHSLTLSRVRDQGYDGTSNIQGAINGLKTLILNESPSAYFVHCFTHQLQLTLIAVTKKNADCGWLFVDVLAPLLNFVGSSPKRKEFLREKQAKRVVATLSLGELESGTGLNQSHFKTILNVLNLYPTILESLDAIGDVSDSVDQNRAESLTHFLMSFNFIFMTHLMKSIFAITNELNMALQKSDQDIVNAMKMRYSHEQCSFIYDKYEIENPNTEEKYVHPSRRKFRGSRPQVTNFDHFRVELFLSDIDLQLQELENRFDEVSKELLISMSSFSPANQFSSLDIRKLRRMDEFYLNEFSTSIGELSMKLFETGKHETH